MAWSGCTPDVRRALMQSRLSEQEAESLAQALASRKLGSLSVLQTLPEFEWSGLVVATGIAPEQMDNFRRHLTNTPVIRPVPPPASAGMAGAAASARTARIVGITPAGGLPGGLPHSAASPAHATSTSRAPPLAQGRSNPRVVAAGPAAPAPILPDVGIGAVAETQEITKGIVKIIYLLM